MRRMIGAAMVFGAGVLPISMWGSAAAQPAERPAVKRVSSPDRGAARWSAEAMRGMLDRAMTLQSEGRYAEATAAVLSLWECPLELVDDERHQIRGMASFIAEECAAKHAPSRRAFFDLRQHLASQLQGEEIDLYVAHDWIRMNGVIGDEARSMYFYDESANDPGAAVVVQFAVGSLVHQAFRERRWDVVAALVADPVGKADGMIESMLPMLPVTERQLGVHPYDDAGWVAGLVEIQIIAALHTDDGGATERRMIGMLEEAMGGREAWRIAFIHSARLCGKLREDHVAWIGRYELATKYPDDPVIMGILVNGQRAAGK